MMTATNRELLASLDQPAILDDIPSRANIGSPTHTQDNGLLDADRIGINKKDIFHYQTDWLISTLAWYNGQGNSMQLALGSFLEDYLNKVTLVKLDRDAFEEDIEEITTFDHPYPPTKILWMPSLFSHSSESTKLLATTADYLRLWRLQDTSNDHKDTDGSEAKVKLESLLNSNLGHSFCAPLTSFDWNQVDPSMIVTSSVDTTCAIWDIEVSQLMNIVGQPNARVSGKLKSQVMAHNNEVYDVSFFHDSRDIFVSSGADGSARLFDLRKLDTSTILFEVGQLSDAQSKALVRVSCNKQDSNYISTFRISSSEIILVDLRKPGTPIATLGCHVANVNSMSWAPHSAHHICSASDDHQALIWQLSALPTPVEEPVLAYKAGGHINAIDWSASHPDWISIGYEHSLELLRV